MKKFILFILCVTIVSSLHAQLITVSGISVTGRFTSCNGNNSPNITASLLNATGSSVVGGIFTCLNPCDSSTIRVTMSNLRWDQSPNSEWLHGLFLPANAGFTMSAVTIPTGFITYNPGCVGNCPSGSGTNGGPGFYFDNTAGNACCGAIFANDGYPCNNYGDVSITCNSPLSLTFDIKFCNSVITNGSYQFVLTGTSDGETGCWNFNDVGTHKVQFSISTAACVPFNINPTATSPIRSCAGSVVNYTSTLTGTCSNNTLTWWNAPSGGSIVGTGSPFVYDPAGSACPAGTTLYATCCSGSSVGCVARTPITIPGSCTVLGITSISSTNSTCAQLGAINSINATNTQSATTYSISPSGQSNATGIFTGLNQPSYTVTVTDASGCTATSVVTISQPPSIQFNTPIVVGPTCNFPNSGQIACLAVGGVGIISYSINPSATQTSTGIFAGLSAQTYTITATDMSNCTATTMITLVLPPTLSWNLISQTNLTCNGINSGTINATAVGGSGTISYNLMPSNATNTVGQFNLLAAGNYTITATDANGCTLSTIILLTQPPAITWSSVIGTNTSCNGASTGAITSAAIGGTGTLSYTLLPTGTSNTTGNFSGLGVGNYTVQVSDANACSISTIVAITQPPLIVFSSPVKTSPLCYGDNNGSIVISSIGGTGIITYTLNPNGITNTTGSFTNLGVGTYTINAVDANSCSQSTIVTLTQPSLVSFSSAAFVSPLCNTSLNGSIAVSATGGTGSITYVLAPSNATNTVGNFYGLGSGTYTITATDIHACSSSTVVTITAPAILAFSNVNSVSPLCNGQSNGSITATATGGSAAYSFNLLPPNLNNTTGIYTGLSAGTYTIKVTDAHNCTATSVLSITQPTALNWTTVSKTNVLCNGANTGSISASSNGGTNPINYTLLPTGTTNATGSFTGLTIGTYTVKVADANSCSITSIVIITQPTVLNISSMPFTSPNCIPGNNGTISVNATGGTTNYTYSNGGAFQSSNVFNGLAAGTYTITVKDANLCTATSSVTLITPGAPSVVSLNAVNVSCNGAGNGSITMITSGGTPTITYTMLPQNTSNTSGYFSNLNAGTFTITATDVNLCTTQSIVTITSPVLVVMTNLTATNVICNGGNTGTITAIATGGTGTLTYNMQPGNVNNTTGLFTGLGIGTYVITVTDINGCSTNGSITITQLPLVVWSSVTQVDVSCSGGTNGSITAIATGGLAPITYSISPGSVTNTTGLFTGLSAQVYFVTATDANGCSTTVNVSLIQPSPLIVSSIVSTVPTCVPGNDGSMTINVSGGVGSYNYNIGMGNSTSNVFTGLGAGNYTIHVSDANGCTAISTTIINIPNAPYYNSANKSDVSCHGLSNGQITVHATGGTGIISYTLQPSNVTNTTGSFPGLAANTYIITASDANGCAVSTSIVVSQPLTLQFTAPILVSPLCNGQFNGSISVGVNGGNTNFSYTLLPTNSIDTSGYFSGLGSGLYTVNVIDSKGCTATTSINLTQAQVITWTSFASTNISCNGGANGSINAQANGGTGIISYLIQPLASTNNTGLFTNLGIGSYTMIASDANGCSISSIVTITQPTTLSINTISITPPNCVPGNNGSMTINASGGVAPYAYSIGGANQASANFSNLGAATYTVTVTDANLCSTTSVLIIATPGSLNISSFAAGNVSCNGANNGTLNITTSGGIGVTNYILLPNGITNTSGNFSNLGSSTYTINAVDANGCSVSTVVSIIQPSPLSWNTTSNTNVTCNGANDGSLHVTCVGGTGIIQYTLLPSNTTNTSGIFNSLSAATYTINAVDANGCSISTTIQITQPVTLTWSATSHTNVSCNGGADGTINAAIVGGTGSISYTLQPGNSTNATGQFMGLANGIYTVQATDGNGCSATTSIQITEPTLLQVTNVVNTIPTCIPGNDASLTVTASGGTPTYTYSIGGATQSSTTFTSLGAGVYTVSVTDSKGCTATGTQTISIPNAPIITNVNIVDVSCYSGSDGSASVTASGGTGMLTYSIQPNSATNTIGVFSNLSANTYTVSVTDASGCAMSSVFIINQASQLNINSSIATNVTCQGLANGSISIAASGGTGTISYTLQPSNTTNTSGLFSNLAPQVYTITCKDVNNCSASTLIIITEPLALSITNSNINNIFCFAGNDGNISMTVSGGTGNISYTLNPGGQVNSTGYFNSLVTGSYTVTGVDANGCSISSVFQVTQPTQNQILNIVTISPSCVPGNDGSITITVSGGTPSYSYSINGGNAQSSNFFSGLSGGSYSILISDANNCKIITNVLLSNSLAPTFTLNSASNVSCNNGSDGAINISATGGTGAISYTLQPGAITNTNGNFTLLNANSYTITAIDAGGCSVSTTVVISQPTALSWLAASQTNATCNGVNDGTLSVGAAGGTGIINYTLLPNNSSNASGNFIALSAATYTVKATDANGCSITTSLTIQQPAPLSLTGNTITNVSCNGGSNGSIQVGIVGGTGAYSYTLLPSTTNTTGLFNSLSVGVYTIVAVDANACSISTTIQITEPTTLAILSITNTIPSCIPGNDASMTIVATGGSPSFSYSIGGAAQSSNVFSNLGAGTFTVNVTDANNCSVSSVYTISTPNAPNIVSALATNVLCNGGSTGTVQVAATGGIGAITYNLQPTSITNTTGNFNTLFATTYTITATDANGCAVSTTVIITQPNPLVWSTISSTNVSCNGFADATISVVSVGGTGSINYSLLPTNVSSTTGNFSSLSSGSYTVQASDVNGCSITTSIIITQPNVLSWISVASTNVSCHGGNDGNLQVITNGGTWPINYTLLPTTTNSSGSFSTLSAATYTIQTIDANGCSLTTSVVITEPNLLSIANITNTFPSCIPGNDASMTITSSGGTIPYSYSIGGISQSSNVFSNLGSGIFTINVTDANNCSVTSIYVISTPNAPSITSSNSTNVTCFGGANGDLNVLAIGGTGNITYTLQPGNVINNSGGFLSLVANTYTVNASDANGCAVSTTILISQPSQLNWIANSFSNVTCNSGSDGTIQVSSSGGTGIITYTLLPSSISNTTGQFSGLSTNSYTINAVDANACSISTIITIQEPTALVWTLTTNTNVSCNGGADASIQVNANGGNGVINYTLQASTTNTTGIFGSLSATSYTINAVDANACSISTVVLITEPTSLVISNVTNTIPSCVPGNDATLTITTQGGTPNYIYSIGGASQINNTFSNLGPGIYTISVSDANNCSVTSVYTVTSPNAPSIQSVVTTNASCSPGGDATATVTASGGIGLLSYSSDGVTFLSSTILTNLSNTTYTIIVKDALGCSVSSVITISNQPLPSVNSIITTNASCLPGCDGTAIITASGGSSGLYSFSLDTINFQANMLFTSLCSANYTVQVKDGNGCTSTSTFNISTANAPIISTFNSTNVSCFGGTNATISMLAIGGTGTISYTLQANNITNTTGLFTTLNANTYTIIATDINGCSVSSSVQIIQPQVLQFDSVNSYSSLCSGASNGSIDVPTSGGTGLINYTISPSATFQAPHTFTNVLGNTSYTITATDINGCSISTIVFVSQPSPLSITTLGKTDLTCNGLSNGSISINAFGGTGILTYTLSPSSQQNITGNFTNLSGATYTITISDANNCSLTTSIFIYEPSPITQTSLTASNVSCHDANDGSISIVCNGGVGVLTYTLQPTNTTNITGSFTNLSGAVYTLTIHDTNNCSITTNITIVNPLLLEFDSVLHTDVLCFGDSNGSIMAIGLGGTGAYSYTLLPLAITNSTGLFASLSVGSYTIIVSDANACSASSIVNIVQPNALIGTLLSKTNITCFGGNDGAIYTSANGGTQPYTFTLQPSNTSNTNGQFTTLTSGIYTVIITDMNACSTSISGIQLTSPQQLLFDVSTHTDIPCYGDNSGTITVHAFGGTGTIQYSIQPLNGVQNSIGSFSQLYAGIYTIVATDAIGCTNTTSITILQNPAIVFDVLTFTEPVCYGENNASIHAEASGGFGVLTYYLNGASPQTFGSFSNLAAGYYTITIIDGLGCSKDTVFNVTQPDRVGIASLSVIDIACPGASNGKIIVSGSGGRPYYTYYVRPGLHINRTGDFSGFHEGIYTITVKDSSGCTFDTTVVIGLPTNSMNVTITKQDLGCFGIGNEGWAQANVNGGEQPYTYLWSTTPPQYTDRATNLFFGYYFVEVVDANGCIVKDTTYIEPGPCCDQVFIPNAFSPNGDGTNDVFRVTTSSGIELIQFDIYDRWGNRVWGTSDFRQGWDGTYKGSEESGNTFYYIFWYKCLTDGEKYMKKGDIILVR